MYEASSNIDDESICNCRVIEGNTSAHQTIGFIHSVLKSSLAFATTLLGVRLQPSFATLTVLLRSL